MSIKILFDVYILLLYFRGFLLLLSNVLKRFKNMYIFKVLKHFILNNMFIKYLFNIYIFYFCKKIYINIIKTINY